MDILEVIAVVRNDPHLYTQIQQKTQMNSRRVSKYLVEMAMKGLLTVELIPHAKVAKKEYKITEIGRDLFREWLQFKEKWETQVNSKSVHKVRT